MRTSPTVRLVLGLFVVAPALLAFALLSIVVILLAVSSRPSAAFCNQDTFLGIGQCPGNAGGHKHITEVALGFLRPTVLDDIIDEHIFQDTRLPYSSAYHFDNCRFHEATQYIATQYTDQVLPKLNPASPAYFDATDGFGQLLHTAQDFYSHSNWIEMGRADLVDSRLTNWAVLNGWTVLRDDVMVAQGEASTLPPGWSVTPNPTTKVPTVTRTSPVATYKALISGYFGLSDDCHDTIALSHDVLHKDDSTRIPNYAPARDAAIGQTRHEWCRLVQLVRNSYGQAGVNGLIGAWVKDDPASRQQAVCSVSSVGGITGLPDDNRPPAATAEPSGGPSSVAYAAIAGGASALAFVATGGWYVRRRRAR